MPAIAARLQRILDDRGASISEAARLAGMHRQQVHAIVSGRNPNPNLETVRRIVEAVGGEMSDLFTGSE